MSLRLNRNCRPLWRLSTIAVVAVLLGSPTLAQGNLNRRLEGWYKAQVAAQGPLSGEQMAEGNALLDELRAKGTKVAGTWDSQAKTLLHIVGRARLRSWSGLSGRSNEEELELRTRSALHLRLNGPLKEHLLSEVLLLPRIHERDLRAGVALLLGEVHEQRATLALLAATRDPDRHVRDCAVESLLARDDPTVHRGMIQLLKEVESGELELTTLQMERHFHTVTLEPDEVEEEPVYHFVREHLTAKDWHLASRGISISKALTDRRAAPPLIEAMNVWLTRKEAGLQAARVLGEIEEELVARSGLKLGQRPERWRTWWRSVKVGEARLPADSPSAARTRANFFGLRPETDRVIFVLDRSGSMGADFKRSGTETGRKPPTRFDEATAQLLRCLEDLGESARFDVILFSDRARRFRGELVPAQEKNLQSLAKWIRNNGPDGGTNLRPGIEMAMSHKDPATLEADTIIVLCDGETMEGEAWVAPFIRSANDMARVRFHAVQLGGRSDGTLEALCNHTDGDYVEVRDDR